MIKISDFIIGLIFCSFIIFVFGSFMSQMNKSYGVEYDNESLEVYNQLDKIQTLSEDIEQGSEIEERTGVLDIVGGYFTGGYTVLKMTKGSFNTFETMSNKAISDANLGPTGNYLRVAVSSTILILIVLAVIISAIVKRDL